MNLNAASRCHGGGAQELRVWYTDLNFGCKHRLSCEASVSRTRSGARDGEGESERDKESNCTRLDAKESPVIPATKWNGGGAFVGVLRWFVGAGSGG